MTVPRRFSRLVDRSSWTNWTALFGICRTGIPACHYFRFFTNQEET
jgi:hypothetical protein